MNLSESWNSSRAKVEGPISENVSETPISSGASPDTSKGSSSPSNKSSDPMNTDLKTTTLQGDQIVQ